MNLVSIPIDHKESFIELFTAYSSQLPYKSMGDWIIADDYSDQKLGKQDQPLAVHRITRWENCHNGSCDIQLGESVSIIESCSSKCSNSDRICVLQTGVALRCAGVYMCEQWF